MATITRSTKETVSAEDLGPILSARWVLKPRHLVACLFFGGLILYINTLPLLDSTIWLDVGQGRWILSHSTLPATDPAQPLTDGMRVVHTTWLSQVVFGLADHVGGPRAVSNLFTLVMLACLLLLARIFYVQTKRVSLMLAGLGVTLLVGATFDLYASAEVFGQLAFVLLLWMMPRIDGQVAEGDSEGSPLQDKTKPAWPLWIGVIGLFAVWANLHGSYLLGIVVLGCYAAARACETGWKERSIRAVLTDEGTRQRILLSEAALFASFLNPYGPMLLLENLALLGNEQFLALPEWRSLNLATPKGVFLIGSVVFLALLMRLSQRRVRLVDILLLGVFGAATVATGRAQGWYALVYAFVIMPYVAEASDRLLPVRVRPLVAKPLTPRSFIVTLLCGLTLYCAFRLAPASRVFLGGNPREMGELIGSEDLLETVAFLQENPAKGLVYAKTDWSDYLAVEADIKVLMTSNVQWVPRRIWGDHRRMAGCEEGWQKGMDRYGVEILVLDKEAHGGLVKSAARSDNWRVEYENDTVLVARRVGPDRRAAKPDDMPEDTQWSTSRQKAPPQS